MMNQKEIEAAGAEEYALWRSTKDRVNSIKEYMVANATTHLNRLDKVMGAAKAGDMEPMTEMMLEGVGGGMAGVVKGSAKLLKNKASEYARSFSKKKKGPKPDYTPKVKQPTPQSGTADVMEQLEFNKNIDVIEYFKPVNTKAQMAAAVNALKHRFSNYDRLVVGIGKNNYNKMQESIYGSLEKTLAGKQMNQQSQWARELYVEKMRGLGVL
jgi:hypothetical protein